MKTAILYSSKHGTTRKVVDIIATKLGHSTVTIMEFKKDIKIDFSLFDTIIIGGSVYVGSVNKELTKFCVANSRELIKKRLGVFVCGMEPDNEKQQKEIELSYPEIIRTNATSISFFGGELLFSEMNFFERIAIKNIAKIDTDTSNIDYASIDSFIAKLNDEN